MTWTSPTQHDVAALAEAAARASLQSVVVALTHNRVRYVRALRRRLPSASAADDAFQELAIKAVAHAPRLKSPEKADAWIRVLLRNEAVNWYRRAARESREAEAAIEAAYLAEETDQAPLVQWSCLLAALADLSPAQSELIGQLDVHGRAANDVATAEGLTRNALNVRLHRARRALRRGLQSACARCSLGEFGACAAERSGAGVGGAAEPRSFAPTAPRPRTRPA